jgi:glutathione S-transferase
MNYTLVSSDRSPFGRICRMFMLANDIKFKFEALNFVDDEKAATALAKETPINKVPYLIDGKEKIFDSRVITNYLIQQHDLPPLTVEEENIVSAVYSVMDSIVSLFLLKRDGIDVNGPGNFFRRNRERIPSNLDFVTPWAKQLDPNGRRTWDYPAMSLYACLEWGERRAQMINMKEHPALADFLRKFAQAPGVQATGFQT